MSVRIGPKQRKLIDLAAKDAKVEWRNWSQPGRVLVALYTEAGESYLGVVAVEGGAASERGSWDEQDRPKLEAFAAAYARRSAP